MTGISGISSASMMQMRRPDSTKMAEALFSKLDTAGQGYIEKTDLQAAMQKVSAAGSAAAGTPAVDDLFAALDSDSDGKVTKQEFTDTLKKLEEQFQKSKMAVGAEAPAAAGVDDGGPTDEELANIDGKIGGGGGGGAAGASTASAAAKKYEAADTDKDGKVTFKEAVAYEIAQKVAKAKDSAGSNQANATSQNVLDKVEKQIMQLMQAYLSDADSKPATSSVSVSA
jgi:hypothetical protein